MTDAKLMDAHKATEVEREARRLERIRRLKAIDGGRAAPPRPEPEPKAAA